MSILTRRSIGARMAIWTLLIGSIVLLGVAIVTLWVSLDMVQREVEVSAREHIVQASLGVGSMLTHVRDSAADLVLDLAADAPTGRPLTAEDIDARLARTMTAEHDVHAAGVLWTTPHHGSRFYLIGRKAQHLALPGTGAELPPSPFGPDDLDPNSPAAQSRAILRAEGRADTADEEPVVRFTTPPPDADFSWLDQALALTDPEWLLPAHPTPPKEVVTYVLPLSAVTGSEPLAGSIAAVVIQIPLPRLSQVLMDMPLAPNQKVFVLTPDGRYLAHQDLGQLFVQSGVQKVTRTQVAHPGELAPEHLEHLSTFATLPKGALKEKGVKQTPACWLATTSIERTDWTIGVVEDLTKRQADTDALHRLVAAIVAIGLVALSLGGLTIGAALARPIRRLDDAAGQMAGGELAVPVPISRGDDEVAHLGQSFETMRQELLEHIEELAEASALRERIASEMRIAEDIQQSLLPNAFVAPPGVDLAATLLPAREVGGDLYELRMLDDHTLLFAVGDVAGKGVPAALFMAVTMSQLRSLLGTAPEPAKLVAGLNDVLSEDNPETVFVTFFLAILELQTGRCRFTSGGHNPPVLLRRDGEPEELLQTGGIALGVMGGLDFPVTELQLDPGDLLFCYTDGVNEAMSPEHEQYTLERASADLAELRDEPCDSILVGLLNRLIEHRGNADQSDDITILLLRYDGPNREGVSDPTG